MSESTASTPVAVMEHNKSALTMLVAALGSIAIGPFWYLTRTSEFHGGLAALLLALPSILIVIGAGRLLRIRQQPETLTRVTALFDVAKNAFVAAYVYFDAAGVALRVLSAASLLTGLALLLLVYRLTSWMMDSHDDPEVSPEAATARKGIVGQLQQHRFLGICGLLVAYLNLQILLGLSVAFHDRANNGMSFERQTRRQDLVAAVKPDTAESKASAPTVRTFAFPLGSTNLRCTAEANGHKFKDEFYAQGTPNDRRVKQLVASEILAGKNCDSEFRETAWNIHELHALQAELAKIHTDAPFRRYRVAVVAHATDSRENSGFSSNYEMSRARAEQVQALIETFLPKVQEKNPHRPPLNLEWQIMPSGTGNMYLAGADSWNADRLEEAGLHRALTTELQLTRIPDHLTELQLEVLARRNADPPLQLLDYLYFMATVATPNDLAPASGFVQFVAAAAHIAQLFLLVVAFNVLLAIGRPHTDQHEKSIAGT
ncbi:MAG TPA: hypothetical protein VF846_08000 [Thermoanaerobaculia bacterium]|jgi:hypothetical protein